MTLLQKERNFLILLKVINKSDRHEFKIEIVSPEKLNLRDWLIAYWYLEQKVLLKY